MPRIVLPAEPLIDGADGAAAVAGLGHPAIVAACQDPEIGRWTRVPSPYGEDDARAYLLQRYDSIHAGSLGAVRDRRPRRRARCSARSP